MKFVSFNINGLRARFHQLAAIIEKHQPDVIGLQEIKVSDPDFPLEALSHYPYHINYHGQKGHYGVAMMTRQKPLKVAKGLPNDTIEAQRRLILTEIPSASGNITIMNGYFPQGESRDHPTKFPAKEKFYSELTEYVQSSLSNNPRLILMGDMNICPTDNDIGLKEVNKKRWLASGKSSFLPEERIWLKQLYQTALHDTFRQCHPFEADRFSWFDYRSKGFNDNIGLRIDLILASESLASHCTAADIDYEIRAMEKPSDHAPIWAEFNIE